MRAGSIANALDHKGQVLRAYLGAPKAGLDAGPQLGRREKGRLSLARKVAPQPTYSANSLAQLLLP